MERAADGHRHIDITGGRTLGPGAVVACPGIGARGGRFLDGAVRQPVLMQPLQTRMFLLAGLIGGNRQPASEPVD